MVDVTQAVFGRVGLNIGRARAGRGWVIALGAERFARVFWGDLRMLVTRFPGFLIIGRLVIPNQFASGKAHGFSA